MIMSSVRKRGPKPAKIREDKMLLKDAKPSKNPLAPPGEYVTKVLTIDHCSSNYGCSLLAYFHLQTQP